MPERNSQIILMVICVLMMPLSAARAMPEGAEAVKDFSVQYYLGTWYKIARLDHRFERGLKNVTATYSMREDGGVSVVNRGFNEKKARILGFATDPLVYPQESAFGS